MEHAWRRIALLSLMAFSLFSCSANADGTANRCVSSQIEAGYKVFRNSCDKEINTIVCEAYAVAATRRACSRKTVAAGSEITNMATDQLSTVEKLVAPGKVDIYPCYFDHTPYFDSNNEGQWFCKKI